LAVQNPNPFYRKAMFPLLFAKFLISCLYCHKSRLLHLRYFVRTFTPTMLATNVLLIRHFYKINLNFFCIFNSDLQLLWTFSIQILCKVLLIKIWLIWTFFFGQISRKIRNFLPSSLISMETCFLVSKILKMRLRFINQVIGGEFLIDSSPNEQTLSKSA
jgi:hypothetical protein